MTIDKSLFTGLGLAFLVFLGNSSVAVAQDQALLIGVGDYKYISTLPGIDLDLANMEATAKRLGFTDITLLLNEQATLNGVRQALQHLASSVSENERVLVYFSGHGSNIRDVNGDEQDRLDEVLGMYDTQLIKNGVADQDIAAAKGPTLKNVLVDDELRKLLKAIPAKDVWVFLDACHSGTASKGVVRGILGPGEETFAKSYAYPGMPDSKKAINVAETTPDDVHFVMLAAAHDNESAIATHKGSLFTLAVSDSIEKSLAKHQTLSFGELNQQVNAFIQKENINNTPFRPQLTGIPHAEEKRIVVAAAAQEYPPMPRREAVQRVVEHSSIKPLPFKSNQSTYQLGDDLILNLDIPQSGYLNIVQINPQDQARVLFPNQFHQDNRVQAGPFKCPTDQMAFNIPTEMPYGEYRIFAFLTTEAMDLYTTGLGKWDAEGKMDDQFHSLSALGLQKMQDKTNGWAGSVKVLVRK